MDFDEVTASPALKHPDRQTGSDKDGSRFTPSMEIVDPG